MSDRSSASRPVPGAAAGQLHAAVVIGGGAVGTFAAALLARAGCEVALIDRHAAPDPIRQTLQVSGTLPFEASVLRARSALGVRLEPELVVLAVKMPDVPGALDAAAGWPGAAVLTLENGVGAEELARERRTGPVIAGSLTAPIERASDGVRRLGAGGLGLALVAPRNGDASLAGDALVADLARVLDRAGLRTVVVDDAAAMKWSKLVANLIANATSALLERDAGEIYTDPILFDLERRQLREALAVMAAMGLEPIRIPGANVPLLARGLRLPSFLGRLILAPVVGRARGGKHPSLRLHLDARDGPSEIAWLNGAVARAGVRLGVPTPVNAGLEALVEEAAAGGDVRARIDADGRLLVAAVSAAGTLWLATAGADRSAMGGGG